MIHYLSEEQVVSLHAKIVRAKGGTRGIRDKSALAAAVARPYATFDGEDLYPTLAEKASALMHSLAMNHPFLDGNKRIAVASAEFFIEINGCSLTATDHEFEDLTMALASSKLDKDQLAVWFKQRIVRREDDPGNYVDIEEW